MMVNNGGVPSLPSSSSSSSLSPSSSWQQTDAAAQATVKDTSGLQRDTASSAKSAHQKRPVQISIVGSTTSFIDSLNHQQQHQQYQDCASNQSGSDSGLGYTNSISSDNSSINAAAGQQQQQPKQRATNDVSVRIKSNNNASTGANNSLSTTGRGELGSIEETSQVGAQANIPLKNVDKHSINNRPPTNLPKSGRGSSDRSNDQCDATDPLVMRDTRHLHSSDTVTRNELVAPPSTTSDSSSHSPPLPSPETARTIDPCSTQQPCFPIKSLIKKPSQYFHGEAKTNKPKHNRSVSFNQTVVVFCEEIETTVPDGEYFNDEVDDRLEVGDSGFGCNAQEDERCGPAIRYQDPSTCSSTFEPPEDYCDREVDHPIYQRADQPGLAKTVNSSAANHLDKLDAVLNVGEASNLTDDQLIGILENESLLDTFKLNIDQFSDEEFIKNHIDSNHGYLCNEAMSDYDSDSESSVCFGSKDVCVINRQSQQQQSLKHQTGTTNNKSIAQFELPENERVPNNNYSLGKNQTRTKIVHDEQNQDKVELGSKKISSKTSSTLDRSGIVSTSQSMPARMKVSTVDANSIKRQANRKEDHDLKTKVGSSKNITTNQLTQNTLPKKSQVPDTSRTEPILVKQSVVEPIALYKPTIVSTNCKGRDATSTTSNQSSQQSIRASSNSNKNLDAATIVPSTHMGETAPKPIDLINGDVRQSVCEAVHLAQKQNLSNNPTNSAQTSAVLNQPPACHICRVIESTRSQINNNDSAQSVSAKAIQSKVLQNTVSNQSAQVIIRPSNQVRPIRQQIPVRSTIVNNQSCASCYEASTKHVVVQNGMQSQANTQSTVRPVAYQLVYVVDQKGNRVRALVRAAPRNPDVPNQQQQPAIGRRIFIAQNGIRFPNPNSTTGQVIQCVPGNHVAYSQWPQTSANNPQPAKLLESTGQASSQNVYAQQTVHQLNRPDIIKPVPVVSSYQRAPIEGAPMRQHTVYYVRQPLDAHNIRQSFESTGSNPKSFPDPHEIRRLDGLRGPTAGLNLTQRITQNDSSRGNVQQYTAPNGSDATREETDDPTFGFSDRPSVKVVAANSNLPMGYTNVRSRLEEQNYERTIGQVRYPHVIRVRELGAGQKVTNNEQPVDNMRNISMIAGSQTLDRRQLNQHQSSQMMKDNIPSTSSMLNIHGTYASHPKSAGLHSSTSQQPRVSGDQMKEITFEKPKSLIEASKLDATHLDGQLKGVIVDSRVGVAAPLASRGRQISGLNRNELLDVRRQVQPDQFEVAYSMNI